MLTAGYAWSPDRRYLAVSERHHGKQYVGVYDAESIIRVRDRGVREPSLSTALRSLYSGHNKYKLESVWKVAGALGLEPLGKPIHARPSDY